MGGWQTHICNWPGFSCLTYTISSEETSQTLFSWRLRVCSSLHGRWKSSIIFTGFWIGSIPARGECSQLLRCRNWALSICKNTHQTQGMWGSIFINTDMGMEKTWIQSTCKKLVPLAMILSWLEHFSYRSSKRTRIMESVSMSCHIILCPVLLEAIWRPKWFYPTPLFMPCHTELLYQWFCLHTCKQKILFISLWSLHCYLQLQTAAMASIPFCFLSARRDLFSGVPFSLSLFVAMAARLKPDPRWEKCHRNKNWRYRQAVSPPLAAEDTY